MAAIQTSGERMKEALADTGWVDEEIVAVGHLRQGNRPSETAVAIGTAVLEFFRPRPTKLLPRQFALAITPTRGLVFKASVIGRDRPSPHDRRIHEGVEAEFPRHSVHVTGLEEGAKSMSATMTIESQSFPVWRPITPGDPNTEELFKLLAR